MDAELIRRWNNKVGKGDLTYFLGDMIWKARNDDAPELIKSLNGQIILIKGNHDRFLHNAKAKAALAGIKDYGDICVSLEDGTKKRVILSHYFTPMYNGHRYQAIHLHAHSHFTDEADFEVDFAKRLNSIGCRNEIYNIGCMYWNYEPVTLDEIIEHGRTIRPTYGERSAEYMAQFPWEKNQTVNPENEIRWNVFYHNCNSRSIETFNVFEHGSFREYVKKAAKKYQNKEDFCTVIMPAARILFRLHFLNSATKAASLIGDGTVSVLVLSGAVALSRGVLTNVAILTRVLFRNTQGLPPA